MELEDMDLEAITPRQVKQYLKDKFVIVASNRGPVEFRRDEQGELKAHRGAGGVVTAMSTALVATDAVWISTARTKEDAAMADKARRRRIPMPPDNPQYYVRYIVPDKEEYDQYYNVISNSILWYLNHYLFDVVRKPVIDESVHQAWNEGYRKINRFFADEIIKEVRGTDKQPLIFLQDYHLYLCAHYIRRREPDVLIHHFTHSPWVQPDYLRFLPQSMRRELLQGMLSNDVLGFHTPHYANNFLQCCREAEAVRVSVDNKRRMVRHSGHETFVKHYPISIDHDALEKVAGREDVAEHRKRLRKLLSRVPIPDHVGVIARTAGAGSRKTSFIRDLRALVSSWEEIRQAIDDKKAPALLYQEPQLVDRIVRDLLTEDVRRIVIDPGQHEPPTSPPPSSASASFY